MAVAGRNMYWFLLFDGVLMILEPLFSTVSFVYLLGSNSNKSAENVNYY